MVTKMSLLDLMAVQAQCACVSDLKYIDHRRRLRLAEQLRKLPAEEDDLHDWTNALEYLTGKKTPYAGAEQTKAALLAALSGAAPWGWM